MADADLSSKLRLARMLAIVLAIMLAGRGIAVVVINGERLGAGKLEGTRYEGRYYPIERLCLRLSDRARSQLNEAVKSDAEVARSGMSATGNSFDVDRRDGLATLGCGYTNLIYQRDPRVRVYFRATVYRNAAVLQEIWGRGICVTSTPGYVVTPVETERARGCRVQRFNTVQYYLLDDNAVMTCDIEAANPLLVAPLSVATQRLCDGVFDELADAHPVSYWSHAFWTWR